MLTVKQILRTARWWRALGVELLSSNCDRYEPRPTPTDRDPTPIKEGDVVAGWTAHYEPRTGELLWKPPTSSRKPD